MDKNTEAKDGGQGAVAGEVDRLTLRWHLRRIYCAGQIPDVVFSGALQASALSYDQTLLVTAPPLNGVPRLPGEIGVPNLGVLLKRVEALRPTKTADTDNIVLHVTEEQLVLSSEHAEIRHPLVDPRHISTRIDRPVVEKLERLIGEQATELDLLSLLGGVWAAHDYARPFFEVLRAPGVVRMRAHQPPFDDGRTRSLAGGQGDERCDLLLVIGPKFRDICETFENSKRVTLSVKGPRDFLTLTSQSHTGEVYRYLVTPVRMVV
jgi:hypothetical protein